MDSILSMEMLLSTLRMAIPLVLASVGGTLCERSGIINLGIEGMMLSGAFGAVYGTYISGNPWIGVLFAILVGGLFPLFPLFFFPTSYQSHIQPSALPVPSPLFLLF